MIAIPRFNLLSVDNFTINEEIAFSEREGYTPGSRRSGSDRRAAREALGTGRRHDGPPQPRQQTCLSAPCGHCSTVSFRFGRSGVDSWLAVRQRSLSSIVDPQGDGGHDAPGRAEQLDRIVLVADRQSPKQRSEASMYSSMIGKIEKAHRYAREPERVRFSSLQATFHGGHDDYVISLTADGWECSCHTFQAHMVDTCSHIMALQQLLAPMLSEDDRFSAHHDVARVGEAALTS
jgi:hypothetical protein